MIDPNNALLQLPSADEESAKLGRRNLLGTMGMTCLGLLASGGLAQASKPRVSVATASRQPVTPTAAPSAAPRRSPLADVSRDWAVVHGQTANHYIVYLRGLKLRSIDPDDVIAAHAKKRGDVWNSLPPKNLWNRMGYILRVVDRIALEMNVNRVEVLSAYRSPAYNARCGGRRGSWHQANIALDFRFPHRASQVTRTARELRDLGLFKGGVGGYWNFTHVDARGQNINW